MLQIHFIDDAGNPLCSVPDSDRWLWTVNPRGVTCSACLAALTAGRASTRSEEDANTSGASTLDADTASGTG